LIPLPVAAYKMYNYYRCSTKTRYGKNACLQCKTYQAEETETHVWKFVSDLLRAPDRLRSGAREDDRAGAR